MKFSPSRLVVKWLLAGALMPCGTVFSIETAIFKPVADTTLIETAPDNNMGTTLFVIAGTAGVANSRNRGLYKFNVSSIPSGAKIFSAKVGLEVVGVPSVSSPSSIFSLHRLLKSWGEGAKDSTTETSPGLGFPATAGEATWNSRFAFTTNSWRAPGASGDFVLTSSSFTNVNGLGDLPLFNSSPQMVSDVQLWLTNPATNFGWLLKTDSETTSRTARRFSAREATGEDTNAAPYLAIEFVRPPTLGNLVVTNGQFRFSFLAESNSAYEVQFVTSLGSTNLWQTLTNISAPPVSTIILVADTLSSVTRFYRVLPQ